MNNTVLENVNSPLSVYVLFILPIFFRIKRSFINSIQHLGASLETKSGVKTDIKYPSAKLLALLSNDSYASLKLSEHATYAAVVSGSLFA
jgi:hypothetical protein